MPGRRDGSAGSGAGERQFCIEEFYPVFDSAGAKIVKAELERPEGLGRITAKDGG